MADEHEVNRDEPEDGDSRDNEPNGGGASARRVPNPWLPKLPDFQAQQQEIIRSAMSKITGLATITNTSQQLAKSPLLALDQRVFVPRFEARDFYSPLLETVARLREQIEADRLLVAEHAPPNWPSPDELINHKRLHNVAAFGIPVAWVPRAEVLVELAESVPDTYLATLSRFHAEIVEDCQQVTEPILQGRYKDQAVFVGHCLQAFAVGAFAACQALASAVAETALRYGFVPSTKENRFRWGRDLRDHIDDSKTFEDKDYRRTLVLVPFEPAYRSFDYDNLDEERFGRNVSLHRVDTTQYTPTNALVSLMLAVSALRETHEADQ